MLLSLRSGNTDQNGKIYYCTDGKTYFNEVFWEFEFSQSNLHFTGQSEGKWNSDNRLLLSSQRQLVKFQ